MKDRKVWKLVTAPCDVKPLGCRWVYTIKKDDTGKIARYKARLVAQGYSQIKGETYDETFSPVVNFSIIRFFFSALVSCLHWTHIQCDVKCAYLYAPLDENIWMKEPKGFETNGEQNLVCKLQRAIYGLHQSGRLWFFELHRVLEGIGFKKLEWCNCSYSYGSNIVLLVYVDDFVIFGKSKNLIEEVIMKLTTHFDLKILGKTKKLLGVEFEEDGDKVFVNQTNYISEVFKRFQDYYPSISSLPIAKGTVFSKLQCPTTADEVEEMKKIPYRNVIGCLSYITSHTRPDIAYAVNIFSQFQANPGKFHWNGLLKLLGYVQNTKDAKLQLSCSKIQLKTFTDADFAANRDDRTSLSGQISFLGEAPITWRANKQKSVSLSTMEAEFVALTEATKELVWFNNIITECHDREIFPGSMLKPQLKVDNMAAIAFIKSPIETYKTKHIDVKLFFVRDLLSKDIFEVSYVKSKENLADIFTKPMTKLEISNFKNNIFKLKQ